MIRLTVDLLNPGQFFACCGAFELAARLWPGATAHFEDSHFVVSDGNIQELVSRASEASIDHLVAHDSTASPLLLGAPFSLRLDWWKAGSGEPTLKTWAGRMQATRIAKAMQRALTHPVDGRLFDDARVVFGEDGQKVEPFYFDARRGASSLSLDVGFSADALSMKTVAHPAVEFLTLVGLQRFRPSPVRLRVFRYRAWRSPLSASLAALAVAGVLTDSGPLLQFESMFRTDQRKDKAFSPAIPVDGAMNE